MVTASIEDLTWWIPRVVPTPRITIVRMYAEGIKPVEPNEFVFAVVAVVWRKVATIKALCNGVSLKYIAVGAKLLHEQYGVIRLDWRHNGICKSLNVTERKL